MTTISPDDVKLHTITTETGRTVAKDVVRVNIITVGIQGPPGVGTPGEDGEPGVDGDDGREIELRANMTHIQWRYVGDVAWTDLIALSLITGPAGEPGTDGTDGREIELQKTSTHIQWRYVGAPSWTNLVALVDITGPKGDKGDDGDPGPAGADGEGLDYISYSYSGGV